MTKSLRSRQLSRRSFLAAAGSTTLGAALMAACAPSGGAPAESGGGEAPAAGAEKTTIRAHMVEKQDVSAWIQMGLDQDIDGFVSVRDAITTLPEAEGKAWAELWSSVAEML